MSECELQTEIEFKNKQYYFELKLGFLALDELCSDKKFHSIIKIHKGIIQLKFLNLIFVTIHKFSC